MAFVIGSENIDINIDEIVDNVLSSINEDYIDTICNHFESQAESKGLFADYGEIDNFFVSHGADIVNTENFIIRRVAERLLEK